jgi:hypothetical protein
MKIGVSVIAVLAVEFLFAAPGASARGSSGVAFASPRSAVQSRPVFVQGHRTVVVPSQRRAVVARRLVVALPLQPRRPFPARHRIFVENPILLTSPAFATPLVVIVRPVCCG